MTTVHSKETDLSGTPSVPEGFKQPQNFVSRGCNQELG